MTGSTLGELTVGKLIKSTWEYGKSNFVLLTKIGVLANLLPIILGLLAALLLLGPAIMKLPALMANQRELALFFQDYLKEIGGIMILSGVFGLASVLASGVAYGALLYWVYNHLSGKEVTLKDAMQLGWKRLGFVVMTGILNTLGVLGGAILLIIPGIYLGVLWGFSVDRAVLTKEKPMEAIKGSAAMVKGRWWNVVGRYIVVSLLLSVIQMIVQAIFGGLLSLSNAFVITIIISLLVFIVQLYCNYFLMIFGIIMYKNLESVGPMKA